MDFGKYIIGIMAVTTVYACVDSIFDEPAPSRHATSNSIQFAVSHSQAAPIKFAASHSTIDYGSYEPAAGLLEQPEGWDYEKFQEAMAEKYERNFFDYNPEGLDSEDERKHRIKYFEQFDELVEEGVYCDCCSAYISPFDVEMTIDDELYQEYCEVCPSPRYRYEEEYRDLEYNRDF